MSLRRKQEIPDVTFYPQENNFVAISGEFAQAVAYNVEPTALVIATRGHYSISPPHLAYRSLRSLGRTRIANEDLPLTAAEIRDDTFAWLSYRQIARRSQPNY